MATLEELKSMINLVDYARRSYRVTGISDKAYRINPCPICGRKDHFTIYSDTQHYLSFSKCCEGGSILDFMMEVEGMTMEEAIDNLYTITGTPKPEANKNGEKNVFFEPSATTTKTEKKATKQEAPTQAPPMASKIDKQQLQQQEEEEKKKLQEEARNFLNVVRQNNDTTEAMNYLEGRGISGGFCWKYDIMAYQNYIYIPLTYKKEIVAYVSRAIDPEEKKRYKNSRGSIVLFNSEYITEKPEGKRVIYITEGIMDALTIENVEEKSIALNSVSNIKLLKELIKTNKQNASEYLWVIACDNDNAGKVATTELQEIFLEENLVYEVLQIPSEHKGQKVKDTNELYNVMGNAEEFKEFINVGNKYSTKYYLENVFSKDIEKMKQYKSKTTGFPTLDKLLNGVYPGLYTLGAISSLGKTTLVSQLTDQMAESGETILFFSLEQSKFEMTAKSISRQTFKVNAKEAKTALQIMQNEDNVISSDIVSKAINNYIPIAKRTNILEGNFDTTIDSILQEISKFISITGTKPIVVIDYLQIIKPSPESARLSERQQIDMTVSSLKKASRNFDIPIIVISSLNRENYKNTVDFSSFKESGGIEYSSDVVLGLQLQAIEDISRMKDETEKRNKLNEAKSEEIRKIELVCLKNRNGKSYFKDTFLYYSPYNYFIECGENSRGGFGVQ